MNLVSYLRFNIPKYSLDVWLLCTEIHRCIPTHFTDITLHRKIVFLVFKILFAVSEYILKCFKC
jgi:hypothetical protein